MAQQCEPSANKHWQLAAACTPRTTVAREMAADVRMRTMMMVV
jgi:hypothetical protein